VPMGRGVIKVRPGGRETLGGRVLKDRQGRRVRREIRAMSERLELSSVSMIATRSTNRSPLSQASFVLFRFTSVQFSYVAAYAP